MLDEPFKHRSFRLVVIRSSEVLPQLDVGSSVEHVETEDHYPPTEGGIEEVLQSFDRTGIQKADSAHFDIDHSCSGPEEYGLHPGAGGRTK